MEARGNSRGLAGALPRLMPGGDVGSPSGSASSCNLTLFILVGLRFDFRRSGRANFQLGTQADSAGDGRTATEIAWIEAYESRLEFAWSSAEAFAGAAVFVGARDCAADRARLDHASVATRLLIWKSHSGLDPVACINAAGSVGGQCIDSAMEAISSVWGLVLLFAERAIHPD